MSINDGSEAFSCSSEYLNSSQDRIHSRFVFNEWSEYSLVHVIDWYVIHPMRERANDSLL